MNEKNVQNMFKYFSVKELVVNNTASEIKEAFNNGSMDCLLVLLQILDNFREFLGSPITITSAYRDRFHNESCGGSPTSQHMLGEAIDFKCEFVKQSQLVDSLKEFLKKSAFKNFLGQIIIYNSFIHIALRTPKHSYLTIYDKRNH